MVDQAARLHADGSRVRALHYSASRAAASTLVPCGCWLDVEDGRANVSDGAGTWCGIHHVSPIAVCIAALSARFEMSLGEICHERLHRHDAHHLLKDGEPNDAKHS